jgi:DNA-directed RNA polymerase specialized sigma24 family protein
VILFAPPKAYPIVGFGFETPKKIKRRCLMTELANKKLEYQGLFTDLEIGVVKNVINEVQKQWPCLEKEDFDDLLQSCLMKWWTAKDKYNEKSEASLSTFMAAVIRNHLINVKGNLLSDKRIVAEKSVSLDQPPDGDD